MKLRLLAATFIICNCINAQAPSWLWAESAGRHTSSDGCNGIATDLNGNSYITGQFQDTIVFGNTQLVNTGNTNSMMYIAKYDIAGNIIWAKTPGGNNYSEGYSICIDIEGNCYVTGSYKGTITFGSTSFTAWGLDNYFVAKYDSSGTVIWARNAIINASNLGKGICVDKDGNVFVTGTYEDSSITFGSVTLPSLPAIINTNIFLVKYDNAGNVLWAHCAGSSLQTSSYCVAVDMNGNAYLTGAYKNSITFGSYTVTGNNGSFSVFTAKYDPAGNVLWAKSSGGFPSSGYGKGISADASGNCYVVGYFNSAIIIFDNDTLTSAGSDDIFVVKYDSSGNLKWSRRAGGSNYDDASKICTDQNGNSYVTGFVKSYPAFFGNFGLLATDLDAFVAKYDSSGNVDWAVQSNGNLNERANGISMDQYSNVYIAGEFSSPQSIFGAFTLTNSDPYTGSYDIFIAKLDIVATGIKEENFSLNNCSVFPNPFLKTTTLKFENPSNEKFVLSIYNMQGKLVRSVKNIISDYVEIERQNLSSGQYFYQLRSDKKFNATGKLLIE